MPKTDSIHASSFRDPSGFIFTHNGELYRQVNNQYKEHYDHLMESGLYDKLASMGILVTHETAKVAPHTEENAYLVIKPEMIPFITHPYEWCFSQLKDAALLTLYIAKEALEAGMVIKDASAYNIQFRGAYPVFIDTLSFEIYQEDKPWDAYRQFCQHFLAPLALMALTDVRLVQLMAVNIDGVPLDLASKLLPRRTKLNPGLMTHIHLHASAQKRYADQEVEIKKERDRFTQFSFKAMLDSLESSVKKLTWKPVGTEWGNYYDNTNYDDLSFQAKQLIVQKMLSAAGPGTVWDLGANTGVFSRLASQQDWLTVAWDIDPAAVEANYLECKREKNKKLVPLVLDLFNPSPALGWGNAERESLLQRAPVNTVMALALVHHLAISNNVPLIKIAHFFSQLSSWLIIEFVPKSDSQVRRLLTTREDIFPDYNREGFEAAMSQYFQIIETEQVQDSQRILYLMKT